VPCLVICGPRPWANGRALRCLRPGLPNGHSAREYERLPEVVDNDSAAGVAPMWYARRVKRQWVLLDNSAVNALFGQSALVDGATRDRALARLKAANDTYEVGIVLTFPLLEEVAGIMRRDRERFRRSAEALWTLGDSFLIRPSVERFAIEARKRRKLRPYEVFYPRAQVVPLRQAFLDDEALVEGGDEHAYQVKRQYEADEKSRRVEALAELAAHAQTWQAELGGDDRDWHAVVDEWTLFEMRRSPAFYGLPPDESDWPMPRDFVTLWYARAYTVARLIEVLGEGRKIDGGDLYDALHFEDAAYADVFVTNDDGLHRRAAKYALPSPRLVRAEAWIAEVLA
jgi:hypothetical protein